MVNEHQHVDNSKKESAVLIVLFLAIVIAFGLLLALLIGRAISNVIEYLF